MTAVAIEIRGAAKHYPVFRRPAEALRYLVDAIVHGAPRVRAHQPVVRALDDVSLTIRKGERVGIVGRNGAGKTTLLRLLAGEFHPTAGTVSVSGGTYSLSGDAVGFSPDLSAEENAISHLQMRGLPPDEVAARLAEIEAFTELGDYFRQPVKTYSLGMRVRAEFAAATAHAAEILIVDEVLGAGDIYWAERIATRMDVLCSQGSTLVLVSHSVGQILRFCDRALWIERGRVVMDGSAIDVTTRYESFLERLSWHTDDPDDATVRLESVLPNLGNVVLPESGQTVMRWPGHGSVVLSGVWINGEAVTELEVEPHTPLEFRLATVAQADGHYSLRYLLTFWDGSGKRVAVAENDRDEIALATNDRHTVSVSIPSSQLAGGQYLVTISVFAVPGPGSVVERMDRLDVLYKSFRLRFLQNGVSSGPSYRFPMQLAPCA